MNNLEGGYYSFDAERICSVVDSTETKTSDEDIEGKFKDYECYICYDLSLNIQECKSCERIFCNSCIDDTKKKYNENTQCPNNCKIWNLDKPHRSIRNFIENIEFYCKNYKKGCKQKLKISNAKQHEVNNCEYTSVKCQNEGCDELLIKKLMEKHQEQQCQFRRITCEKCDMQFKVTEEQTHDCISSLKQKVDSLKLDVNPFQQEAVSLKQEVSNLQEQIKAMYTKEHVEQLFEEYIRNMNSEDKPDLLYAKQTINPEQQDENPNKEEEEQKSSNENYNNQEKNNQKELKKQPNHPLFNIFESAIKFIKEQSEKSQQNNQQNTHNSQKIESNQNPYPQQNQNNFNLSQNSNTFQNTTNYYQSIQNSNNIYPPTQNMYPPPQNQSNMYPPQYQSNTYPPQNCNNMYPPQNYSNMYPPQNQSNMNSFQNNMYPPQNVNSSQNQNVFDNNVKMAKQQSQPSQNNSLNLQPQNSIQNLGCNHSLLDAVKSIFDINQNCQCGKLIQRDYCYCGDCRKYICLSCCK